MKKANEFFSLESFISFEIIKDLNALNESPINSAPPSLNLFNSELILDEHELALTE